MEEKYFPRGSLQKNLLPNTDTAKQHGKKRKSERNEEDKAKSTNYKLFGQPQPAPKKPKKTLENAKEKVRKKKKLKERKKTGEKKPGDDAGDESFSSHPIKLKTLLEDTLVLGAVKEILEFQLVISLPSGIKGVVKVTKISDVFTERLEKMSEEDPDEENLEEANLSNLYQVGDIVPCRVLGSNSQTKKLTKVDLSVSPTDVNKDISAAMLHKDMVIIGVVHTIEDHGYTIDTGISGANVFLSGEDAKTFLKKTGKNQLRIAGPVRCLITKVASGGRSVNVTLDPEKLSKAVAASGSMAELVPGRMVTAQVEKVQETMLQVSFAGAYHGCVDALHLLQLEDSTASYKRGEKYKAVILYQCPSSKTFGLSFSPAHSGRSLRESLPGGSPTGLKEGTKVKKAKVIHVYKKRGIVCDLENGYKGYAIPSDYPENTATVLIVGNSLPCRALHFQLFDMVALVSFRESVIGLPFLGYGDLGAGQLLKGFVSKFVNNGVVIEFKDNKRVTGFVSHLQVADVPIKNVTGMFEKGTVLQLRVLQVQPEKKKLLLTHKKTLIESKLPVITSYDQFREGQTLNGTIATVGDYGCVVMFYNGIRGLLHKSELSNNPDAVDPTKDFYVGQVIKCHVKRTFDPKSEKVHLSLRSAEGQELPASVPVPGAEPKSAVGHRHSKIFETDSATVTAISEEGLSITMDTMMLNAFIPKMHLCDFPSQQDVALRSYAVGDAIKSVMVWAKSGDNWIVSCKPTLLRSATHRHMKPPYGLRKNKFTVGIVKEVTSRGILVDFSNNNIGLCSPKEIPHFDEEYFQPGLTVKVIVLDNNLKLSMRVASREGRETGKETQKRFREHFQMMDRALKIRAGKDSKTPIKIGSNVHAHVTEVQEGLVFAETREGTRVIVTEKPSEDLKTGAKITGCILDVDPINHWLIVTIKPDVVKSRMKPNIKRLRMQLDKLLATEEGQVLYSTLLYHMAFYKKQLFYVPAVKHINEPPRSVGDTILLGTNCLANLIAVYASPMCLLTLGSQEADTLMTLPSDVVKVCGRVIVLPHSHGDKGITTGTSHESLWSKERNQNLMGSELEAEIENKQNIIARSMGVNVGQTLEVVVKRVNRDHLLVRTDSDVLGRIHITEITNTGRSPMKQVRKFGGRRIRARIVGFLLKSGGELVPVTHPNFTMLSLELTTKESKLEEDFVIDPKTVDEELDSFTIGQKVIGYPTRCVDGRVSVTVSPRIHGKVDVLDLSDNLTDGDRPEGAYPYGEALDLHVVSVNRDGKDLILSGRPEDCNDGIQVQTGDRVMGRILNIIDDSLYLQLPHGLVGRVFATDARDRFTAKPLGGFKVGQYHKCYVLQAEPGTHVALSLRLSRVEGRSVPGMDDDIQSIDDLRPGQKVKGYIVEVSKDEVLVSFSRDVQGLLEITPQLVSLHPKLQPGIPVSVVVSSIEDGRPSLVYEESVAQTDSMHEDSSDEENEPPAKKLKSAKDPDNSGEEHLKKKREGLKEKSKPEADVLAKRRTAQKTEEEAAESSEEDTSSSEEETVELASSRQEQKSRNSRKVENSPEKEDTSSSTSFSVDESPDEESSSSSDDDDPGETTPEPSEKKQRGSERKKSDEKPRLSLNISDAWDEEGAVTAPKKTEDSSSESEEEEQIKEVPKKKKKTKQERLQEVKAEEEYLYKTEHALMDSERPPETVDDFDRLVTTSPNSSIVWIRFMAFHLDAGDVEKARAVAERALKTISFREEQEKLNVWVAFMNLENTNGSDESILKVFERALGNCEPYRVFEHLIDIYTRSGKIKAAESLYNTMLKRFRLEKSVWVQYGTFLMQHGKADAARSLLQRSFKSLVKKDHIDVISKFAQLEYKSGEPEQGQTMFENVLSNYPKRTDIWSIYLDMVIKSGDLKNARQLFDRVITLNLSPKKIKFFFKRYLDFEKKHGMEEQIDAVKQKAIEYVESKSGLVADDT